MDRSEHLDNSGISGQIIQTIENAIRNLSEKENTKKFGFGYG